MPLTSSTPPVALARGRLLAVFALMVNAFVWGVSWWPFRQLQNYGLHPLWVTAFIYSLATTALLVWRPRAWGLLWRQPALWLLLVLAGTTNVAFNWAVTVGDVVRVVLLFYLMPGWAVLLAWWVLKEKPTGAALLRLVLALLGVMVVLKSPDSPWPVPQSLADWLSLAGGFCFAATNVLLRKLASTPSQARMLAMFAGGALMAWAAALAGLAWQMLPFPGLAVLTTTMSWAGWAVAALLLLCFWVSNIALQYGATRLAANTTSLVMLTEILFATVSAALLGAAELTSRTLLGGLLIVLPALWAALATEQKP